MKFTKITTIAATIALCGTSFGAGFQVLEQGASNMGTSMAGAVTNANNDATAAFNNPSAFAFSELEAGKTMASMGMSFIVPTLGLASDNGKRYDCGVNSYVPNFFFAHKFTDDLALTLSVTAPFGLESDYEDDFIGKMQGLNSYLFTVDVNPSLVYKVTDWLSINGGVSAQYTYCRLTNYLNNPYVGKAGEFKLSGSSWGVGGNIGFTVEYMEGGRFGFHWRSAVQQDLHGTARHDGTGIGDIDASVEMPDTFTFGIYQKLPGWFDEFAVMLDYSYVRWSSFDKLLVTGLPMLYGGKSECPENWKDTSRVSFGIHYQPEYFKKLLLRAGICYDESPVPSATDRTVRIPCSDRLWYSVGAGYQLADNISLDLAYVYIMTIGNSDINRSEMGQTVTGHYYGHIHVVSAQINFTF